MPRGAPRHGRRRPPRDDDVARVEGGVRAGQESLLGVRHGRAQRHAHHPAPGAVHVLHQPIDVRLDGPPQGLNKLVTYCFM